MNYKITEKKEINDIELFYILEDFINKVKDNNSYNSGIILFKNVLKMNDLASLLPFELDLVVDVMNEVDDYDKYHGVEFSHIMFIDYDLSDNYDNLMIENMKSCLGLGLRYNKKYKKEIKNMEIKPIIQSIEILSLKKKNK